MALKNLDNANPKLKEHWMEIVQHGWANAIFPTKKTATSVRTQLNTFRTLASRQAPSFYEIIQDYLLSTQLDYDRGGWVVVGISPRKIDPNDLRQGPSKQGYDQELQVFNPAAIAAQHHNPLGTTVTGFPIVMPEALPHGTIHFKEGETDMPAPTATEGLTPEMRKLVEEARIKLAEKEKARKG